MSNRSLSFETAASPLPVVRGREGGSKEEEEKGEEEREGQRMEEEAIYSLNHLQ